MITFFIKTYGCQANEADSVTLGRYLSGLGCQNVSVEAEADLIIINSCAIRQKAEHKMFSYVGDLLQLKKNRPYLVLGVIGCVASYRKKEMMDRFEHLSFVFSARDDLEKLKAYLADLIESIATQKQFYSANPQEYKLYKRRDHDVIAVVEQKKLLAIQPKKFLEPERFKRHMINIMRGCNNYCSYCIVPFTTGRERSFSIRSLVESVSQEVAAGAKEVTLLGQNVNSYKDPETGASFATLLERVARLEGEFWVRFLSPHPKDMTRDVLEVMAAYPQKLCAFVHLPLQSGSNKILASMNRTYTVEKYLDQIAQVKMFLPHATLTTDVIVGFPGETEADFLATRNVVEQVDYTMIFSFIYSPRQYTKAAQMKDDCSYEQKLARLESLQVLQRERGTLVNQKLIGTSMRVLIEGYDTRGWWWGRNEGNIKVRLCDVQVSVNQFVEVTIEDAGLTYLEGRLTCAGDTQKKCNEELSVGG